jgi:hypothetical protein
MVELLFNIIFYSFTELVLLSLIGAVFITIVIYTVYLIIEFIKGF